VLKSCRQEGAIILRTIFSGGLPGANLSGFGPSRSRVFMRMPPLHLTLPQSQPFWRLTPLTWRNVKYFGVGGLNTLVISTYGANLPEVRDLFAPEENVVVLGGGTGGFAAALAAARMGKNVVVVEQTDWVGGQLTSQAVPPDEHPWIEKFGCTLGYRRFRDGVRRCFKDHFPLRGKTRVAPMTSVAQHGATHATKGDCGWAKPSRKTTNTT
jgi:hypothetical protein